MDRGQPAPVSAPAQDTMEPLAAPAAVSPLEPLFLTPVEAGEESAAWHALADHAMEPNPFFRSEFLMPYLLHAEKNTVAIAAVRRRVGGALAALAPLGRRPLGLVRRAAHVWTHAYGPLGTPLLAPDHAPEAAAKLLRLAMLQMGPFLAMPEQRLDGSVVAAFRDGAAACGLKITEAAMCDRPMLPVEGTMESFLAHVSSQRRRRYAKGYRRLKGEGHLVRDHLRGAHAVAAFEDFLALEEAGWKGDTGTAIVSDPHHAAFARKAVEALAASGCLLVDRLRLDGETIAAIITFRDGPRAYAWKISFDETHGRNSPGLQVLLAAMENYFSIADLVEADSLAGRAPSLVDGLWHTRAPFGTLLIAGGRLPAAGLALGRADIAARALARRVAGKVRG